MQQKELAPGYAFMQIELRHPASINGRRVKPQSLWLLLALWQTQAERVETKRDRRLTKSTPALLTVSQLQAQFSDVKHLRMLISRAFVDFATWQLAVGWGTDFAAHPDTRSTRNRSRGPFWLQPGVFEKIQVRLNGTLVGVAEVRHFLRWGQASPAADATLHGSTMPVTSRPAPAAMPHASAEFWRIFAIAKREQLDGHLIVDGQQGALAGYRTTERLAEHPRHTAFALLQQAMVWRRAGNPDAALAVLKQLQLQLKLIDDGHWIGAMAIIVQAWCAYAHRDVRTAERILLKAEQDAKLSAVFVHHPRVQSERANLKALLYRAAALDSQRGINDRERSADQALRHYHQALDLASEAELFDAAASAASNLGWSIWLFARCKLAMVAIGVESAEARNSPPKLASNGAQQQAMRWIALANLLSEQHGSSGGFWNQIYLLRVARDGGMQKKPTSLAAFQRWPVLSFEQYSQQFAPHTSIKRGRSWLQIVRALHTEVEHGSLQVDALQRCNVLFELAWYETFEGEIKAARAAVARLQKRLPELVVTDRAFFRQALQGLPI
jgi:hypothetical protein